MVELIVTAVAAIFSGLAMFFFGYRRAKKEQQLKHVEKRLEDTKAAQEIHDEVAAADDDELAKRAREWVRNG
jgi:hypothetical protein